MKKELSKLRVYFGLIGYRIVKNLPEIPTPKAKVSGALRNFFARFFMAGCGKAVAIEKGASFGRKVKLGDYSGIGINAWIKGSVTIGDYVLMGPNVTRHFHILSRHQ